MLDHSAILPLVLSLPHLKCGSYSSLVASMTKIFKEINNIKRNKDKAHRSSSPELWGICNSSCPNVDSVIVWPLILLESERPWLLNYLESPKVPSWSENIQPKCGGRFKTSTQGGLGEESHVLRQWRKSMHNNKIGGTVCCQSVSMQKPEADPFNKLDLVLSFC